jgi:hypothetical protein
LHKSVPHESLAPYLSSRSDFVFEFVEIFVIEKRLPNSPSRGVDKIAVGNSHCQGTDVFTPDPGICQPPFTSYPPPPLPEGEGEMTSPPAHSTWAGVVKGQPPCCFTWPLPQSAHLLQLYKDCVARGTWARLIFETKRGEEELSISCRVQAGATTSKAASEATAAP